VSDQVRQMFNAIAGSYDRANDVLSFGTHRWWKRWLVRSLGLQPGARALDVATGTGDIARLLAEAVAPAGRVVGVDFSATMIERARARFGASHPAITFETGDAMNLRFEDETFDAATISFGIRNVDDPVAGLREMRRVVRSGGAVGVLETGQPRGVWGGIYRIYSDNVIPFIGGLVSGNRAAYRYLDRTAARFPCGERFRAMMLEAGFENVVVRPLFGGIAYLYVGRVEHTSRSASPAVAEEAHAR